MSAPQKTPVVLGHPYGWYVSELVPAAMTCGTCDGAKCGLCGYQGHVPTDVLEAVLDAELDDQSLLATVEALISLEA